LERIKEKLKKEVLEELTSFQREFRNRLADFIIAAFAFASAFLWRDAINSILNPLIQENKLVSAFTVTIISVLVIVIVSRILKVKKKI